MEDITVTRHNIIENYWEDTDCLPNFIDNTNINHNRCRIIANKIFFDLSILIDFPVLSLYKIVTIFNQFVDDLDQMAQIDGDISYAYYKHTISILQYYMPDCINHELYEGAENIKKFLSLIK